jgi:hypothetical protein
VARLAAPHNIDRLNIALIAVSAVVVSVVFAVRWPFETLLLRIRCSPTSSQFVKGGRR